MSETATLLENRYGKGSRKLGPAAVAIIVISTLLFFGFAIYSSFFGKPVASIEVTSYQKLDENHIQANFTAFTASQPAACVLKAYDTGGSIVGFAEIAIPANNDDTKALTAVVKTVAGASVLRADGCTVK